MIKDKKFMEVAIEEAKEALRENEIPVGAVLVDNNTHEIIAKSRNKKEQNFDVTSHAEINVIKEASKKLKTWRLTNSTLYVTLEPCTMCMSAILQSRISRMVYCLDEPLMGSVHSKLDLTTIFQTKITISKIDDEWGYEEILKDFFRKKREYFKNS